jgi:DNA-binding response OmpR family regulator
MLTRVFSEQDYAVQSPQDWHLALDVVRRAPPSAIFVNQQLLGDRLLDFLGRIHARSPALPIVIMMSARQPDSSEFIEFARVLRKPINPETVLAEFHAMVFSHVT